MTPQPPYTGDSATAWRNYVIAQVAQAALGLLSPAVQALACRINGDRVTLHVVSQENVEEDVEDICFELDVLLDGKIAISAVHHDDVSALDWSDNGLCGIYSAKREDEPGGV